MFLRFLEYFKNVFTALKMPERVLEPEAMDSYEEVIVYDGLVKKYLGILHEGFVQTLLNLGPPQGRILEVGTGTGRIAVLLSKYAPEYEVWAIDLSSNMLRVAKNNAVEFGVKDRLFFIRADAKRLPFKDHSFEMVYSHNMMHHIPDPRAMIEEMVRVLKPGGTFVLRDLKRLRPITRWFHVKIFGLHYDRSMKRQYDASIRAALSKDEWIDLINKIPLDGASLTSQFVTHLTISRPYKGEFRKRNINLPLTVKKIPRIFYKQKR